MKKFLKPLLVVLIFLLCQSVIGGVVMFCYAFTQLGAGESFGEVLNKMAGDTVAFSLAILLSNILAVCILYALKYVRVKSLTDVASIDWKWALVVIFGSLCGIFATNLMSEWVELEDNLQDQFLGMSQGVLGILALAVIGPIVEEFAFREAIIGQMLNDKVKPWLAVVFSALCFGLIHANPAQIPFAFVLGLIFGLIYLKTGNIVVTSIIHIINNGLAVMQMYLYGEEAANMKFKDILGAFDIPAIMVLSAVCIYTLHRFYVNYQLKSTNLTYEN